MIMTDANHGGQELLRRADIGAGVNAGPAPDARPYGGATPEDPAGLNARMAALVEEQRQLFESGATRPLNFRVDSLRRLQAAMTAQEPELLEALQADLGKHPVESYTTEIGGVRGEIRHTLAHLRGWTKTRRVRGSLAAPGARCYRQPEPLGVALISSPWNYPLYLALMPLVGAVAAGNCAIVKPSHFAPHSSRALARLTAAAFDPAHVHVAEGDTATSTALLEQRFDCIFFTGSPAVGRVVMVAAARHLTPVTLELGGKSPCIVDATADLDLAARRIAWGKYLNAGQTCIAPDYLLVQRPVKAALLEKLGAAITAFYGAEPRNSSDYGRIISPRHFLRLQGLLGDGQTATGGESDPESLYIAPTILNGIKWEDAVMQEEIFGPILPVIDYDDLEQALAWINQRPKPLSLYLFSGDRHVQERVLRETSSGGVSINDTLSHILPHSLPFGGVQESGMGAYHGHSTFTTFSHLKSVLKARKWPDLAFKYPPYKVSLDFVRRMMKYI